MDHLERPSQPVASSNVTPINQPVNLYSTGQIIEIIMNVYFFEIENLRMSPTTVAIFAESPENASVISGTLMHNIEQYEPQFSGPGLALFRRSGNLDQLSDALASAADEGLGGYTLEGGWTVRAAGAATSGG